MLATILLSLLTVSFVTSQPLRSDMFEHEAILDFDENFKIAWNFNNTHIIIEMRANVSGWLGVGFSANGDMRGADMHVGWVKEGRAYVTDRHGLESGNQYPPMDTEQNIELIRGSECNGQTVIVFMRQLASCQASQDRAITSDTMRVIYACSQRDPSGDDIGFSDYHGLNRGTQSLLMFEAQIEELPDDDNIQNFDMLADGSLLPFKTTYYRCQLFELPRLESKHHIIKMEPIINETFRTNVHHFTVYECNPGVVSPEDVGKPVECYTNGITSFTQCGVKLIAAWAVGGNSQVLPDHVGIPIGEGGGSRYVKLEIHYDNPRLIEIRDNSGMRFSYTSNLRQYDGGILDVGHYTSVSQLIVPPHRREFEIEGGCGAACIGGAMKLAGVDSINITHLFLHSHLAGRKMKLRHFRNGIELPYIAKDDFYDFNYQRGVALKPEITIRIGDELQTSCTYTSMGVDRPIVGGLGTHEEMCLAFFFYYPLIPLDICISGAGDIDSVLFPILGIESARNIDERGRFQFLIGPDEREVTSPIELANQTIADVMSSFEWTDETANQFEQGLKANYQSQSCLGPQPQVKAFGLRAPFPIEELYQEPPALVCLSPSAGFSTADNATTCGASN